MSPPNNKKTPNEAGGGDEKKEFKSQDEYLLYHYKRLHEYLQMYEGASYVPPFEASLPENSNNANGSLAAASTVQLSSGQNVRVQAPSRELNAVNLNAFDFDLLGNGEANRNERAPIGRRDLSSHVDAGSTLGKSLFEFNQNTNECFNKQESSVPKMSSPKELTSNEMNVKIKERYLTMTRGEQINDNLYRPYTEFDYSIVGWNPMDPTVPYNPPKNDACPEADFDLDENLLLSILSEIRNKESSMPPKPNREFNAVPKLSNAEVINNGGVAGGDGASASSRGLNVNSSIFVPFQSLNDDDFNVALPPSSIGGEPYYPQTSLNKDSAAQSISRQPPIGTRPANKFIPSPFVYSFQFRDEQKDQFQREQQQREQQQLGQQQREQQLREQQIREQQRREQLHREQQLREQQLREQELREKHLHKQRMLHLQQYLYQKMEQQHRMEKQQKLVQHQHEQIQLQQQQQQQQYQQQQLQHQIQLQQQQQQEQQKMLQQHIEQEKQKQLQVQKLLQQQQELQHKHQQQQKLLQHHQEMQQQQQHQQKLLQHEQHQRLLQHQQHELQEQQQFHQQQQFLENRRIQEQQELGQRTGAIPKRRFQQQMQQHVANDQTAKLANFWSLPAAGRLPKPVPFQKPNDDVPPLAMPPSALAVPQIPLPPPSAVAPPFNNNRYGGGYQRGLQSSPLPHPISSNYVNQLNCPGEQSPIFPPDSFNHPPPGFGSFQMHHQHHQHYQQYQLPQHQQQFQQQWNANHYSKPPPPNYYNNNNSFNPQQQQPPPPPPPMNYRNYAYRRNEPPIHNYQQSPMFYGKQQQYQNRIYSNRKNFNEFKQQNYSKNRHFFNYNKRGQAPNQFVLQEHNYPVSNFEEDLIDNEKSNDEGNVEAFLITSENNDDEFPLPGSGKMKKNNRRFKPEPKRETLGLQNRTNSVNNLSISNNSGTNAVKSGGRNNTPRGRSRGISETFGIITPRSFDDEASKKKTTNNNEITSSKSVIISDNNIGTGGGDVTTDGTIASGTNTTDNAINKDDTDSVVNKSHTAKVAKEILSIFHDETTTKRYLLATSFKKYYANQNQNANQYPNRPNYSRLFFDKFNMNDDQLTSDQYFKTNDEHFQTSSSLSSPGKRVTDNYQKEFGIEPSSSSSSPGKRSSDIHNNNLFKCGKNLFENFNIDLGEPINVEPKSDDINTEGDGDGDASSKLDDEPQKAPAEDDSKEIN